MKVAYHKWYSPALQREMELKVYGHAGKPFIVFPTQGGRFFQAEDEGIMETVSASLDNGRLTLLAVDSVDNESWSNGSIHPYMKGIRHAAYENYILGEVVPFIRNLEGMQEAKIGCTGFSMGGYHSANFFFKHPQHFDTVIAISGFYNLQLLVGGYVDEQTYYNSPNLYLKNLEDSEMLNQIRSGKIIICCGQGAYEEEMLEETLTLKAILEQKSIPAWVDIWGKDVNHDWPWWRKMLPYFLEKSGY